MKTRTITYSAVLSALSVVFAIASVYLPSKISPLAGCGLCFLLAHYKTGWLGGILCEIATVLIVFAISGLSATFILLTVLFVPYGIYAYLIRNLRFYSKKGIIRAVVSFILFFGLSVVIFLLIKYLSGISVVTLSERIGKWTAVSLFALVCTVGDFLISETADYISKKLK